MMQFSHTKQKPLSASFYVGLEFSDKAVVITPMLSSSFDKEIQ